MEKEKIPLAVIYKKNGYINIDFTYDGDKGYELLGFFRCLVNKMEDDLTYSMHDKGFD